MYKPEPSPPAPLAPNLAPWDASAWGVALALAPGDSEAVVLAEMVLDALSVVEGVAAGVPVPLAVGLCVPDGVGVTGGVALLDRLVEPEVEALAPGDSVAVGLALKVLLALNVLLGVTLPVLVPVPVPVLLGVCEAV